MSSKKLWCVAIRPEGDSPHEQTPAASKEIAERALARYRAMVEKEGNRLILENFDDYFQVQQWHGSLKQHQSELFFTKAWFKEAMYQCFDLQTAEKVFQYGDLVQCYKKGSAPITTNDFEIAKRFYEAV